MKSINTQTQNTHTHTHALQSNSKQRKAKRLTPKLHSHFPNRILFSFPQRMPSMWMWNELPICIRELNDFRCAFRSDHFEGSNPPFIFKYYIFFIRISIPCLLYSSHVFALSLSHSYILCDVQCKQYPFECNMHLTSDVYVVFVLWTSCVNCRNERQFQLRINVFVFDYVLGWDELCIS